MVFVCTAAESVFSSTNVVIHLLAGSLPACWATAAVTAPSPRDQAAAAGPAVGPGPPAMPVQPAATRPFGRRAVRKSATRPTSKSIYSSI